ncbi:MAG: hypothetical protein JNJ57_09585, partial [Saprospiraceae bacterium]|nr:hypothetical protein [Saprospiraceae bacterium]
TYGDTLGLTDALELHLLGITAKGEQADVIYVDVKEYDNAYSIKGHYKVKGEIVTVNGRLFIGKKPTGKKFKVIGKKADVPELAGRILEKALEGLE